MEAEFWHKKWESREIGFHLQAVNPLLTAHFQWLHLEPGQRVFVPLCGKTLDIAWLLSQGHPVVAAELSVLAVDQLFAELGLVPQVTEYEELLHYRAAPGGQCPGLEVFVGDVFLVSAELLGLVHAVYDRAALVALPHGMRADYTRHLLSITGTAPQLLISFDYDQQRLPGPPFCVNQEEVQRYYAAQYQIMLLDSVAVAGGLKGVCPAQELVLGLTPHRAQ
ncbi:MAG: thiopurine S-methyltransferase [Pseudomonadota bacterium]|nr:thiopurine S-methyltransferase [Pseudomonadota bacterium]